MVSAFVYDFVVDVLFAYMNSEEYIRNVTLGLEDFEVIMQDKDILDKGLYSFYFQKPFSDGWEGLTINLTADYYTEKNLGLPVVELDSCFVCLENVWFCDVDSNNYYFYDGITPFNSYVNFNNKNIYMDDFSRFYITDCYNCDIYYRKPVYFSNFRGRGNYFRKRNRFYFSNFVYHFKSKTHKILLKNYYLIYESLCNYKRNCKMDKVTVVLEFPVFAYKEDRLGMFRNYLFKKIKEKNKYLTDLCTNIHFKIIRNSDMKLEDYIELCEEMKEMGVLTTYEIEDASYLKRGKQ